MENWPYTKDIMNIIIEHVYLIYNIINFTVKNILLYLINLAHLIQHQKITDILSTLTWVTSQRSMVKHIQFIYFNALFEISSTHCLPRDLDY